MRQIRISEHISMDGVIPPVLLEQGLADEVVLAVYPLLLGRGKRCFSDSAHPRELTLVSSRAFPAGVVFSTYKVGGPAKTG